MDFIPPPPPRQGQGGHNPNIVPMHDDIFDQRPGGQNQHNYDMDQLEELLGNSNIHGPNKANNGKNKDKDQKPKKATKPVEVIHEGYIITKAPPQHQGDKPSWARVGKRAMPFDDIKLKAKAANHQKRTGLGPMEHFTRLSSNQQGVVDRIVNEKNAKEKDLNAEWVLADVEKVEEDIRESFWRMGRTTTSLSVIVKRQDAVPMTAKEKEKQSKAPVYDVGEIIDLSEPVKSKDKNNDKDGNTSTKKNGNANGNGKKDNKKNGKVVDFDDDDIVDIIEDKRPISRHQNPQYDDYNRNAYDDRIDNQYPPPRPRNDKFDFPPPPRPHQPDPFAHVGQPNPDPFANQHHQQRDAFARPQVHQVDPFAGVDLFPAGPPPGAIPIGEPHGQYPNVPPPVPMAPSANPFMPEVGAQEQWGVQPNAPWPEPRTFGTARITTRPNSQTRTRSHSRRRSESRHRRRREEESRERREASEERRRRRRDSHQQENKIRRLEQTVEKLTDKVEHWDSGSQQTSSAASTEDDMWSLPRSVPFDSPASSPDRTHFVRKLPAGSLHQRKEPGHGPRPTYYQDRRGPRFSEERVEVQPGYGRRERDLDYRGRSEAVFPATRPRLVHAHTADDYPPQPRYVRGPRYAEPRMQRRLTDFAQGYDEELDLDRRGGRGVDFTRVERGGRYERDLGGERERRRYSVARWQ